MNYPQLVTSQLADSMYNSLKRYLKGEIMLHSLATAYSYDYTTQTSTAHINPGVIIFVGLLSMILAVFAIITMWKLFQKAGRPGWAAIVPVYNFWVLFEISGKPGWWALIGLAGIIPFLGPFVSIAYFVLYVIAMLELAKRFGKDTTFAVVGLILFSIIGMAMLAFGDAKYQPAAAVAANGPQAPTPSQPPVPPTPASGNPIQ